MGEAGSRPKGTGHAYEIDLSKSLRLGPFERDQLATMSHDDFAPDDLGDVGRCIYCASTDQLLSDEHVVPFSLGGRKVLRKASCARCASITARFEGEFARSALGAFPRRSRVPDAATIGAADIPDVHHHEGRARYRHRGPAFRLRALAGPAGPSSVPSASPASISSRVTRAEEHMLYYMPLDQNLAKTANVVTTAMTASSVARTPKRASSFGGS